MRGSPVTETCVKRGSNRGQGPILFLLLYRGSSPFTHCATSAGARIRFPGELCLDNSEILLLQADWTICHTTVFCQMSVTVRVKFLMMNKIPWGALHVFSYYWDSLVGADWTICHTIVFCQMSVTDKVKLLMMNRIPWGALFRY